SSVSTVLSRESATTADRFGCVCSKYVRGTASRGGVVKSTPPRRRVYTMIPPLTFLVIFTTEPPFPKDLTYRSKTSRGFHGVRAVHGEISSLSMMGLNAVACLALRSRYHWAATRLR